MIGIFDSGSGGLTVLKEIRAALPNIDIVYFGDIKNAPYGEKSPQELASLTTHAITLLESYGAKRIVSACNSVSAGLALSLASRPREPDSLLEMVGPTVAHFEHTPNRILIVATSATITSGIYQEGFKSIGKEVQTLAIPELAAHIEFGSSKEEMRKTIREAFSEIDTSIFDTLLLACTHYPLVTHLFEEILPQKIKIFNPAVAVAQEAAKAWKGEPGTGSMRFLISKDSELFRSRCKEMFPTLEISIEVIE